MKVVAINGSPKKSGNTWFALKTVGEVLVAEGIDFEIIHIGNKTVRGCLACGKCRENKNERCSISDDNFHDYISVIKDADGLILGSPVHYSGIAGTMKCFLDRLFYVSASNGNWMRHKIGAAVVAVRRSGGTATWSGLNYYLTISEMIVASSNYWNIIHGTKPDDAEQDIEGVQIMQLLGDNMAWLLKSSQTNNNHPPQKRDKIFLGFVR
jgi:multimeric flavodoxin WrbA